MDSRRAQARVCLTVHRFLSTSECTLPRLQYQDEYRSLLDALYKVYGSSPPNPSDPLDVFPGARALLDEYYSEEGMEQPSPEEVLDFLLDEVIVKFGDSARDVFSAIFNYQAMTHRHEINFNITYTELQAAALALTENRSVKPKFHQIFALSPVDQGPLVPVRWDVDYKSHWLPRV